MSLDIITTVGLFLVVAIIVIREVAQAAYDFLHWPGWLVRWLDQAKREEVQRVLESLGIEETKEDIKSIRIGRSLRRGAPYNDSQAQQRGLELIRQALQVGSFSVGRRYPVQFPYYIDVFSASLRSDYADEAARVMLSHLRAVSSEAGVKSFTKVIGLKSGSPLLAVRVAERLTLPVVLYRDRNDAKPSGVGSSPRLDGEVVSGDKLLFVDDSTTGGRMIQECMEHLGSLNASIITVLVLFEPVGKGARDLIEKAGADFVSVIIMDGEALAKLNITKRQ